MQLVQSRNGVMVGQRQCFQPDFFSGVQSSDGERKPSEAVEWVCKSIMAVRFLKLKTV